jgi:hypothetical protein
VPWCATCDRFLSPSTVRTDGACPTCGSTVEAGKARKLRGLPWYVVVALGVFAVYLAFRLVQGIDWLIDQL